MVYSDLPTWTDDILRRAGSDEPLNAFEGRLVARDGTTVAEVEEGIVRLPFTADQSVEFYRKVGGAHFYERATIPFAMSSLDTPVYHAFINKVLPVNHEEIIVDVGGGDGRNAWHCLERGYKRIVMIDAAAEALRRFRRRIAEKDTAWLDRLLQIEADARSLPLLSGSASCVIAIETLYYLNEDYMAGLRECVRLMAPAARIILSERDYEGGLVLRLLYQGVDGLLQLAHKRSIWDGPPDAPVRSRCFTQTELLDTCRGGGLRVLEIGGTPLLSLLLGYLNGRNLLKVGDNDNMSEVTHLLRACSETGTMRRCHVMIAERDDNHAP